MDLTAKIRTIPDYPKPGILFRDVTTLLADKDAFGFTIDELVSRYRDVALDKVVGIESRGFVIGAPLAHRLKLGFVPLRKQGKLPHRTAGVDYDLEYGTDRLEMHVDAVTPGERVLMVDDLIATGGTVLAGCELVGALGGAVVECCFVVDLPDLGGRKRLHARGIPSFALCAFPGH